MSYDDGMRVRREVLGDEHVDRAQARTTDFTADFQDFITSTAWGVWAREGPLSVRDRSLLVLAMTAALGRMDEFRLHASTTPQTGVSDAEIDELVLQVLDPRDDLLPGVVHVDLVIEALLDDHVDVLVDRAVEHPAAVLPVVPRQVGPPAQQADAQRCLSDDHRMARAGHSSLARRYALVVPMSRK